MDIQGTVGTIVRHSHPITNQDEFNQNVSRALRHLYLLSLPEADDTMKTMAAEDIAVRDRMAEIDAYAFRDEYARFNALTDEERHAEITASMPAAFRGE